MTYQITQIKEILNRIVPWFETNLALFRSYIDSDDDLLDIFNNKLNLVKEWDKWFINSYDSEASKKQILDEKNGKSQPEEIVRQFYLIKLDQDYWYTKDIMRTLSSFLNLWNL